MSSIVHIGKHKKAKHKMFTPKKKFDHKPHEVRWLHNIPNQVKIVYFYQCFISIMDHYLGYLLDILIRY